MNRLRSLPASIDLAFDLHIVFWLLLLTKSNDGASKKDKVDLKTDGEESLGSYKGAPMV